MKKTIFTIATIISLAITTPVWTETLDLDSNQQDNQTLCDQYAQEDQIAPDQMAEYMSRCLQSMTEPEGSAHDPAVLEEESPGSNDDDLRG